MTDRPENEANLLTDILDGVRGRERARLAAELLSAAKMRHEQKLGPIRAGFQLVAARCILNATQAQVAEAAGLSKTTVQRWEAAPIIPASEVWFQPEPYAVRKLRQLFEANGIRFIVEPRVGLTYHKDDMANAVKGRVAAG